MAKQIMQYRYYNEGNNNNQPNDSGSVIISELGLINGTVFTNTIPITQLGIQTLPGTKFYLNNSTDPIIVGSTGIYELDLNSGAVITGLKFSAESIENIKNNNSAYLIIDIVYEKE